MDRREPDLDCLFLHVPKWANEYLPLGEFLNVTFMPMGLPAMAELLRREGFATEILHLGVEWMVDPNWRVVEEVGRRRPRMIGLPLHWHYQSYDVIEVARAVKKASPESFLFLGGITASYFAEEILRDHPFLDAIVEGFGEGPLLQLLRESRKDRLPLETVPSLWWRHPEGIRRNDPPAPGQSPALDDLVFGDLSALRHGEHYARHFGFPLAFSKEYDAEENLRHQTMGRAFFPLCMGRGCPVVCSYCGGNRKTLARIHGKGLQWRSQDRVLEDMERIWDFGYRTAALCFDPNPDDDSYYLKLFERIRREGPPLDLYFETWGLPTETFLKAFAETFPSGDSYIAYSPDSGSEAIRDRNKGWSYSNEALRRNLALAEELGLSFDVFFTLALPGETLKEARETRALMDELRGGFQGLRRLMVWTVQLEPGSPQFEEPRAWGLRSDRRSFADFHRLHGGPRGDTYHSLGYRIEGYFGDERDEGDVAAFEEAIQHLRCMEFCHLADDPRQHPLPAEGRAHCLERRRRLARRRGIETPQRLIDDDHSYASARADMAGDGPPRPRGGFVE